MTPTPLHRFSDSPNAINLLGPVPPGLVSFLRAMGNWLTMIAVDRAQVTVGQHPLQNLHHQAVHLGGDPVGPLAADVLEGPVVVVGRQRTERDRRDRGRRASARRWTVMRSSGTQFDSRLRTFCGYCSPQRGCGESNQWRATSPNSTSVWCPT